MYDIEGRWGKKKKLFFHSTQTWKAHSSSDGERDAVANWEKPQQTAEGG